MIRNTLTLGTSPKLVGSASFIVLKGIMFHICFKLLQYSNNKNKWHTHTKWLKNVWNVFGYTGFLIDFELSQRHRSVRVYKRT